MPFETRTQIDGNLARHGAIIKEHEIKVRTPLAKDFRPRYRPLPKPLPALPKADNLLCLRLNKYEEFPDPYTLSKS